MKDRKFYDNSKLIDMYSYPVGDNKLKAAIKKFITDIYPQTGFPKKGKSADKYYYHIEQISLNLVVSIITNKTIATPRNSNNLSSDVRYITIQFMRPYLTKTLDALMHMGYLRQKRGQFYGQFKRITRFWATDMFYQYVKNTLDKPPIKQLEGEIIRLRGKKHNRNDKKYIGYKDTDHGLIVQNRADLELINKVDNQCKIALDIKSEVVSHSFLEHIQNNNQTNMLKINSDRNLFKIMQSYTDNISDNLKYDDNKFSYKHAYYDIHKVTNNNNLYRSFTIIPSDKYSGLSISKDSTEKVHNIYRNIIAKMFNIAGCKSLQDYHYFSELHIEILHKTFHRTFNEDFDHGGRFYNYLLQNIPSYLRKHITIDGNKTIELDYSGFHLRLLYQMFKKIDYRDDPYAVLIDKQKKQNNFDGTIVTPNKDDFIDILNKSSVLPVLNVDIPYTGFDNLDERTKYKLAQLIFINATDKLDKDGKKINAKDIAVKGILNKLRKEGYSGLKGADVEDIIIKFLKHHKELEEFLYSGISKKLQNIDSQIMNDILVHFARKNIPVIDYHDSVRIEEKYEQELRQVMEDVYEKHVGFKPVIK